MFENAGMKIKTIAKVHLAIQAIASVIIGLFLLTEGETLIGDICFLVGPIILVLGPFVSWVTALLLYGFGEIVDNCGQDGNE